MVNHQDGDRLQQKSNGNYLEYLEEKLVEVNTFLQCAILYPNSFSKEKINDLENQKESLVAEMQKVEWAEKYREIRESEK